jgi:hypothetical protein
MKTETVSRPLAETATRQPARKGHTRTPSKARVVQPARHGGETQAAAHPLRGLFSAAELQQIDERCRAMGRNVVEVVVTALREWVKPAAALDEDSHLENGDPLTPAPSAEADRFAGLAILGQEVARITNEWGELEMIYGGRVHFYFVFEYTEIFEDGEWRAPAQFLGEEAEYRALIDSTPATHIRKGIALEPLPLDEIATWFDQHAIEYPPRFREALGFFQKRQQSLADTIAREAVAAERARIARMMSAALAA